MRTKMFIICCSFIAILLGACLLSACSGSENTCETVPEEATSSVAPTAGLETGNPEGTEPGGDFSDIFDEATPTPAQSATGTPTQQPTQSAVPATQTPAPTGGLSTSTEAPGQNWGPLS